MTVVRTLRVRVDWVQFPAARQIQKGEAMLLLFELRYVGD